MEDQWRNQNFEIGGVEGLSQKFFKTNSQQFTIIV